MIWEYTDATGVKRQGTCELTTDHGGSDVTYYMRRLPNPEGETPNERQRGTLDVLSGLYMKRTGARTLPTA